MKKLISTIPFLDDHKPTPLVVNFNQKKIFDQAGIDTSGMVVNQPVVMSDPTGNLKKMVDLAEIRRTRELIEQQFVRPNKVRKIEDAWMDFNRWLPLGFKCDGLPIRRRVVDIAIANPKLILVRVTRYRKYVFVIDPLEALDFADRTESYKTIRGDLFIVVPIVKFKKVHYTYK